MMKGIDVSSWNHSGTPYNVRTAKAYAESDFVIVKATQARGYVNPYCGTDVQRAIRDGKLWGFYHYAGGNDPEKEAEYFYKHTKDYFGHGIPVLDWESNENKSWGSTSWCYRFCHRIHELTGVWPMIYIQASALYQAANCAKDCALWIAGYPDMRQSWDAPKMPYGTGAWKTWTIWQYTSGGNVDRNIAQLDKKGWMAIAKASKAVSETKTDTKTGKAETAPQKAAQLAVDGDIGKITVKRWQEVMKTKADGVISGQYQPNRKYYPAISAVEFGKGGSALIMAVQKAVGADVDGIIGQKTVMAIQNHLGGLEVDGYLGKKTAKAIQKRLNEGRF
jgi:GH25 family lysozyme M1 (1,4-beta-N-acetylmuramidase)